ncbi:unnamed protein product [Toxocara canis]|uniref:Structural protein n=1 Tax=Toxocara canis TaxID=6265 RepID=A0A183VE39_TOXCA|nr:unnamed protein product [Toxocara canis]
MCTLLPGQAPHITLPVEQPPLKTRLITFAFNTIRYDNKSTAMQISSQLDEGAVIKRVIETLNNDIVGFAFEVSDGKGDMTIHEYGSSADALAALDSLLQIQLTNQNPNQTATYADFVNDIKTAVQLAAGLSTSNIKAMLVAPSEVTSITPSSGLCVIDNTKVDINKIVDAIANYTCKTLCSLSFLSPHIIYGAKIDG